MKKKLRLSGTGNRHRAAGTGKFLPLRPPHRLPLPAVGGLEEDFFQILT
ncbi:MAG: hypothetical protein LBH84_05625 [Prevotellaceae bacterium]|jgi:hypothetical protein|nr:hypothetical protein [Prevotellaceae bacterium]